MSGRARGPLLRGLAVALVAATLTVVFTYPLAFQLKTHLPSDLGDPLLGVWLLWWNYEHIVHLDFSGYWDAPIFHPFPQTLTLSEHMLGPALLTAPLYAAGCSPVLCHNLLFLATFFLALCGMAALARHLGRSWIAALLAGLIFAFCNHRYSQLSHVQVLFGGLAPWPLLFLLRLTRRPSWGDCLGLALSWWLISFACLYHAAFLSLLLALAGAFLFIPRRLWRAPRSLGLILLAAALVGLSLLPIKSAYDQAAPLFGQTRSVIDLRYYGADLTSFLRASEYNRLLDEPTRRFERPEGQLYPGLVAVTLATALFALAVGAALRRGAGGRLARFMSALGGDGALLMLLLGLVAFLLCFGPDVRVHGHLLQRPGPYMLLYRHVPGFSQIRVPTRFAGYAMLGLAALAAGGLDALLARLRSRAAKAALIVAVFALWTAENFSVPLRSVAVPPIPALYDRLDQLPGRGALLELPLNREYRFPDVIYQYYQTRHGRPLLNGYSGFFPRQSDELLRRLAADAEITPWHAARLRAFGARYLIVHSDSVEWSRNGQSPQMFLGSPLFEVLLVEGPISVLGWAGSGDRGSGPGQAL